jgi:hypothetical protein
MISRAPATDAVAIEMPKAIRLIRLGLAAISCNASRSCETARIAADEGPPEKELQDRQHQQRDQKRDQHAQRQIDKAEMQARTDIGCLDKSIIDAEDQDQGDLADEQQAEEEGETLNRFFAALLESIVVDLVRAHADEKEYRRHDEADQDRIDAEIRIDDIGDKGPEHDKGRVGNVDDVEHAEGDRHADRDRGVEAAEQQPGDDRVDREVERDHPVGRARRMTAGAHPARTSDRSIRGSPLGRARSTRDTLEQHRLLC